MMIGCRLTYTCPQAQQRNCESHSHIILALLHASEPRANGTEEACEGTVRGRRAGLAAGAWPQDPMSLRHCPGRARHWHRHPSLRDGGSLRSKRNPAGPSRPRPGPPLAVAWPACAARLPACCWNKPGRARARPAQHSLAGRHHHDDEGLPKGPFKLGRGSRRLRVGLPLAAGPATLRLGLGLDRDPESDSEVSLRAPAGVPAGASVCLPVGTGNLNRTLGPGETHRDPEGGGRSPLPLPLSLVLAFALRQLPSPCSSSVFKLSPA
jgi:hypothetical protein